MLLLLLNFGVVLFLLKLYLVDSADFFVDVIVVIVMALVVVVYIAATKGSV